jgi:hypothetical protein
MQPNSRGVIMRIIQNLTISWETNFYDKNTFWDKVITKKLIWPKRTLLDPSIWP